jgi:hypothetical protein
MDFRWVAFITLWTLLSGPIFAAPTSSASSKSGPTVKVVAEKPARR